MYMLQCYVDQQLNYSVAILSFQLGLQLSKCELQLAIWTQLPPSPDYPTKFNNNEIIEIHNNYLYFDFAGSLASTPVPSAIINDW